MDKPNGNQAMVKVDTEIARQRRMSAAKAKKRALELRRSGMTAGETVEALGFARATLYQWAAKDPAFAEAWNDATQECRDKAEDVLEACAQKARNDPKYQASMIFLLKNARPGRWRDVVDVKVDQSDLSSLSNDQLRSLANVLDLDEGEPVALPMVSTVPLALTPDRAAEVLSEIAARLSPRNLSPEAAAVAARLVAGLRRTLERPALPGPVMPAE
jgi:hypothetical protein